MSEPGSGSDVVSMKLRADKKGTYWGDLSMLCMSLVLHCNGDSLCIVCVVMPRWAEPRGIR